MLLNNYINTNVLMLRLCAERFKQKGYNLFCDSCKIEIIGVEMRGTA